MRYVNILLLIVIAMGGGLLFAQEIDDLAYGTSESFVEFHGMVVQDYYDYQDEGDNAGISTFNNSYAFINVACDLAADLVGIIEIEFADAGSIIEIDRAYADYMMHDLASLKIGKFYAPFIFDVSMYRPTSDMFASPRFFGMAATDLFREVGVELYGYGQAGGMGWGYNLAVGNGNSNGILNIDLDGRQIYDEVPFDTNEHKSVVARLLIQPIEGLELAFSYRHLINNTVTKMQILVPGPPDMIMTGYSDAGEWDNKWTAFSAIYNQAGWQTDMYLITGTIDAETTTKEDITMGHLQLGYDLLRDSDQQLMVGVKYEFMDLKLGDLLGPAYPPMSDEWRNFALGIMYKPQDHIMFKLEYRWQGEAEDFDAENNGLLLQAVMDF